MASLIHARAMTMNLKFNRRFEPIYRPTTKIGKESLVEIQKEKIKEYDQETFYHMEDQKRLIGNLPEHTQFLSPDDANQQMHERLDGNNEEFKMFNQLEMNEINLSRLIVRSLNIKLIYSMIDIRNLYCEDF